MSSGERTIAETKVNDYLTGESPKNSHNIPAEIDIEKCTSMDQ
jgi:hypothetical protein